MRTAWIMEKDDFKYTLSFGDEVFGSCAGAIWWEMLRQIPT